MVISGRNAKKKQKFFIKDVEMRRGFFISVWSEEELKTHCSNFFSQEDEI